MRALKNWSPACGLSPSASDAVSSRCPYSTKGALSGSSIDSKTQMTTTCGPPTSGRPPGTRSMPIDALHRCLAIDAPHSRPDASLAQIRGDGGISGRFHALEPLAFDRNTDGHAVESVTSGRSWTGSTNFIWTSSASIASGVRFARIRLHDAVLSLKPCGVSRDYCQDVCTSDFQHRRF
jgi:hypothetical protein